MLLLYIKLGEYMIYKRCPRCSKRIVEGTICPCLKNRHKEYKKYRQDNKEQCFYASSEWLRKKEDVKAFYSGIDIYSFYILHTIEEGQTVHHIVELKEDWSRRLDNENLIYLTEANHQLIHKLYKEDKEGIQKLLCSLIERYRKEFKGVGGT